jgi:diaminopimelate epimerase
VALAFVKMQGLGNDFVVVDRRDFGAPVAPAEARGLCDRRLGIGADGVLSLLPSRLAPFAMQVTNSDGSTAEMCGNGLRCVVRYAIDRALLPESGGDVETGRGVLKSFVEANGDIRVDMGPPVLDPTHVPVRLPGSSIVSAPIEVSGERLRVTAVSMGNPHAVVFLDPGQDLRAWAERIGPVLEQHPAFPNRTNVELARITAPGEIELVVWERGAGLTQACGTGACATVVAAILNDRARCEETWRVRLPGGPLRVQVTQGFGRVWMTGPAVEVFHGEAVS